MKSIKLFFLLSCFILLVGCKKEVKVEKQPIQEQNLELDDENKSEGVSLNELKITVNNEEVIYNEKIYKIDAETMVPLRETANALNWSIKIKKDGAFELENKISRIKFKSGDSFFMKDDFEKKIEVPLTKENGKLFIPLRPIAQAMGEKVTYEESTNTINIISKIPSEVEIKQVSIPVLVYHGLAEDKYNTLMIDPKRFEEQMKALHVSGYSTITEKDLLDYMKKERNLPEKPVMIHFDDGYESVYTHAYPVLKKFNMKATSYLVNTTVKEKTTDKEDYATKHLSWEQVKEMYDSEVFDFQSHTFATHTENGVLDRAKDETDEKYKERLYNDFVKSKKDIETRLGNKVIAFAYPVGNYNEEAIAMVKKAGYEMAFSMDGEKIIMEDDMFILNRIYVSGADNGNSVLNRVK